MFLTTQYLEEADRACDRVAILDGGHLVKVGTPQALKKEVGGGRLTLTIADASDAGRAADVLGSFEAITRVQARRPDEPFVVYVDDPSTSVAAVLRELEHHGIRVAAVEQSLASLDDVFLRYTGERPRVEARIEGAVSGMFRAAHGRRHAS